MKEAGFSVEGLTADNPDTMIEETEDEVIKRLESIGSHVGSNFAER